MTAVGLLTIGQASRRDELAADVAGALGDGYRVLARGALDGLSRDEIAAVGPRPGGELLVSQLADGTSVRLDRDAILARLQAQVDELETAGVVATLLLCTGEFPSFSHRRPLLVPSAPLRGAVLGLAAGGRIASMVPLPEQVEQDVAWWREVGADPIVVSADPYGREPLAAVEAAAAGLLERPGAPPAVLFLDCFGYSGAMRERARRAFPGPVILARSLAARLLAELAS